MNAFLRKVLEQRELEQEAAIIAREVEELIPPPCRVCGGAINMSEGRHRLTVCSKCGGRKRQARLELEDQVEAARRRRQRVLLSVVYPQQESTMAERLKCTECGEDVVQRGRSRFTECEKHRAPKASAAEAPPSSGLKVKRSKNTRKNFKVLCAALGFDADELLGEFQQGWIDRIRASVQLPGDAPRPGDED